MFSVEKCQQKCSNVTSMQHNCTEDHVNCKPYTYNGKPLTSDDVKSECRGDCGASNVTCSALDDGGHGKMVCSWLDPTDRDHGSSNVYF
jgi:hypothetical protein